MMMCPIPLKKCQYFVPNMYFVCAILGLFKKELLSVLSINDLDQMVLQCMRATIHFIASICSDRS